MARRAKALGIRTVPAVFVDGTHGDIMGGDGVYSYMDEEDMMGCHGINAPNGQYMYSFWAEDVNGQRSNTATMTVVRE